MSDISVDAEDILDYKITEDDVFIIGYGGWVKIKKYDENDKYYDLRDKSEDEIKSIASHGKLVQVTSASVTRQTNLPVVTSYYLPYKDNENEEAKSQILLGEGTYSFSGEISFELNYGALKEFIKEDFFKRCALFSVSFFDGQNTCLVTNCVWSSLQIQCAPGNLVTVSLSYQSNNGYMDELQIIRHDADYGVSYDETDFLIPYWTCGHKYFQEFSLSFERNVTPVFLNGTLNVASYLRPGLVTLSLSTTTVEYIDEWDSEIEIDLGEDEDGTNYSIKLLSAVLQSCQYSMSSMSDTGAKSYSWNSISDNAFNKVFEINGKAKESEV